METKQRITIARGDGIGPEIMDATMEILMAAGARIEADYIEVGEKVYLAGNSSGISPESMEILRRNKIFLKAPITTPQGGGYKSLNVNVRKTFGLYSNVRPAVSYHPFVPSAHPKMNLVIVRENEEDLYAGIEHQQTPEVFQCLKILTRPGTEKIIRYAFEFTRSQGRKKLTCMTKDNIMKLTDGMFHKVFDEVGKEYPDIEQEHWIIDIGMAKIADSPADFDVIVMPNLYGDIASDVAAQVAGSVGLAGSANIGDEYAMFEAIHGSAPRRAGQNLANPSGLLHGAILMLLHIGQNDVAEKIHNAWLKTIEDRVVTYDLARKIKETGETNYTEVGTREFAQAVIERLGQKPSTLKVADYGNPVSVQAKKPTFKNVRDQKTELVGSDVFIHDGVIDAQSLGHKLEAIAGEHLKLIMISNRGQLVYPGYHPETFCTDHWRCRFERRNNDGPATHAQIRELLSRVEAEGLKWIKLENLYYIDGQRAYSLSGGQ